MDLVAQLTRALEEMSEADRAEKVETKESFGKFVAEFLAELGGQAIGHFPTEVVGDLSDAMTEASTQLAENIKTAAADVEMPEFELPELNLDGLFEGVLEGLGGGL